MKQPTGASLWQNGSSNKRMCLSVFLGSEDTERFPKATVLLYCVISLMRTQHLSDHAGEKKKKKKKKEEEE